MWQPASRLPGINNVAEKTVWRLWSVPAQPRAKTSSVHFKAAVHVYQDASCIVFFRCPSFFPPEEFSDFVTTGFGMKGSGVLKQEATHTAFLPLHGILTLQICYCLFVIYLTTLSVSV
jgi:hypothetical protein